ncbi:hypothetical protein W02_33020 [Nitrospira sp. KM1]|uniref:hypothetical protein n=1 Tax=Nitrospira sp. KM1 TaxID=1936990 RepID=UPI0013A74C28|nr:hypothetical protein [Nitrospira sp. KM1]BCA56162.1 hypothetical protein W02_33020 [Nitrospira sp. KM1]
MNRRVNQSAFVAGLSGMLLTSAVACMRSGAPLDLQSFDPASDQHRIASYYSREASVLRHKSREAVEQAAAYEQVFGPDSEWVSGARLLAQFYEAEAQKRERMAWEHLNGMTDMTLSGASTPR